MKVATYSFSSYDDRKQAANDIYYKCNGYAAYEEDYYNGNYIIHILRECNDVDLAMKICIANGGNKISW
jgi:hypothetical protein